MTQVLTPDYLSIDFTTVIERIKTQLAASDTFQDYNYEGSNFTVLMELFAYVAELNIYYLNKLAKNIHIETADTYEAANRASRMMGYEPKGPVSSQGTVTVTVSGALVGQEYRVNEFTQLTSTEEDEEGDAILFANTTLYSVTPTAGQFSFDMNVRQGTITDLTGYTGEDLIDNELLLPDNYAYDNNLDDEYPSLQLWVNSDLWNRLSDFYDDLSPYYTELDSYMFIYDRYERSKILFSSSRNVPSSDDTIALKVLVSLGADGDVGANTITGLPDEFLYSVEDREYLANTTITITNPAATTGGADAETIDTVRENARAVQHSQFRNVAAVDYESHLESRSDVVVAQAWGEQEIAPSGDVLEFNRVHLSVIPTEFSTATINTSAMSWYPGWETAGSVDIPSAFNPAWRNTLLQWVEPRKMISAYEVMERPDLVYFSFDFGVRKKRLTELDELAADIKNKLNYWFRAANHDFNEVVNFNDIIEYILDPTEVSPTNNFTNITGIRNLNLRDIDVHKTVYEPNEAGNYPQYIEESTDYIGENKLRKIKLGFNQFPVLQLNTVEVTEET
jgi:hypothetical protein